MENGTASDNTEDVGRRLSENVLKHAHAAKAKANIVVWVGKYDAYVEYIHNTAADTLRLQRQFVVKFSELDGFLGGRRVYLMWITNRWGGLEDIYLRLTAAFAIKEDPALRAMKGHGNLRESFQADIQRTVDILRIGKHVVRKERDIGEGETVDASISMFEGLLDEADRRYAAVDSVLHRGNRAAKKMVAAMYQ